MRYQNVALTGLAHELPPDVVTSADLEEALGPLYEALRLPEGRLEMMSGVRERRFFPAGTRPSQVSVRVARAALADAGVAPEQVGALFHTSVCRDFLEPATASVVAGQLGLGRAAAVHDISNACLGFLNGIVAAANMVELGQIEAAVVVSTEDGRHLYETTVEELNARAHTGISRRDIKQDFASLTIGSGSVAAVIGRRRAERPGLARVLGGVHRQATEHHGLCRSAPDRGFASPETPLMETDAEALLIHGCALAKETWADLEDELGWKTDTPSRIFCHQVGASYRRQLMEALELDPKRDYPTFPILGNTGSAALPQALAMAREEPGFLEPGAPVAMLGIGSGLNCVMLGLEWT